MGFVPPTSPVYLVKAVTKVPSCSATLRNIAEAERLFAEVRVSLADQERVERNLAATGREPLPSERKILGPNYGSKPRKITLE